VPLPGAAAARIVGRHSIAVAATPATGGVAPISMQWEFDWPRDGLDFRNTRGVGVTTLNAVVKNLGPASWYKVMLLYMYDVTATTVSNVLSLKTLPQAWFPGLSRRRPRRD
jgi:hypothetical protein